MSTRELISGYNKSIRDADAAVKEMINSHTDMSHALNDTGTDFNLADEAGSKLNSTLDDQIKKGLELARSMAGPGVDAHKAVQDQITKTYEDAIKQADAMIKAAGGTDVNGQAAIDLARNLLNIPKDVDVKTWVDTEASRQAVAKLQGSLDALPTYKSISVDVKYTASGTQILNNASDAGNTLTSKVSYMGGAVAETMAGMYGGGLLGFDGGGLIPGTPPSRPNVDNILATVNGKPLKVRSGEFITNEPMTKVNLPWLKASNAGLNLGDAMASRYASGYVQGAAQAAPQYAAAASSGQQITNNVSVQTNASPDDIARAIAWSMRTS